MDNSRVREEELVYDPKDEYEEQSRKHKKKTVSNSEKVSSLYIDNGNFQNEKDKNYQDACQIYKKLLLDKNQVLNKNPSKSPKSITGPIKEVVPVEEVDEMHYDYKAVTFVKLF